MRHGWFSRVMAVRLAVILFVFLLGYLVGQRKVAVAQAQGVKSYVVPKAWGHCVGALAAPMGVLIYEDANGVVRIATSGDGQLIVQANRN